MLTYLFDLSIFRHDYRQCLTVWYRTFHREWRRSSLDKASQYGRSKYCFIQLREKSKKFSKNLICYDCYVCWISKEMKRCNSSARNLPIFSFTVISFTAFWWVSEWAGNSERLAGINCLFGMFVRTVSLKKMEIKVEIKTKKNKKKFRVNIGPKRN